MNVGWVRWALGVEVEVDTAILWPDHQTIAGFYYTDASRIHRLSLNLGPQLSFGR